MGAITNALIKIQAMTDSPSYNCADEIVESHEATAVPGNHAVPIDLSS